MTKKKAEAVDHDAEFAWKTLTSEDQRYVAAKDADVDGAIFHELGPRGGPVMKALQRRGLVEQEESYGIKLWMRTALGERVYTCARKLQHEAEWEQADEDA